MPGVDKPAQESAAAARLPELLARGHRLADAVANIRRMLYGLALDLRQAQIAQRAIDEAVRAERAWRELSL